MIPPRLGDDESTIVSPRLSRKGCPMLFLILPISRERGLEHIARLEGLDTLCLERCLFRHHRDLLL